MVLWALIDDGAGGDAARATLSAQSAAAPHLIDIEVLSGLRGLERARKISARQAVQGVADLAALPLRRMAHTPLVARIWELRRNVTAYDAAYVALAEDLDATLVTTDARLARASGIRCSVELLGDHD